MHRLKAAKIHLKNERIIWVHAASFGEYNIIRPVLQQIRANTDFKIFFTFFSVTGVQAMAGWRSEQSQVDYIFYLPLDSKQNVRRFLDYVKPEKAVFVKSEFWPNYLRELHKRNIPTYLISALVSDRSALLRWYGRLLFGDAIKAYTHVTTLDAQSCQNLQRAGIANVELAGDPLFDFVATTAQRDYQNPIVEQFRKSAGGQLFIAGSIHDNNDLNLVSHLAEQHPDIKFLFVPHEVSARRLWNIESRTRGLSKRYSACTPSEDFSQTQILIIDFVGALSRLYRYGTWAYVGGGFTPLLHSVIEPIAYGLPISFGPRIERKITPRQLVDLQLGKIVETPEEINEWFNGIKSDASKLEQIKQRAAQYTATNMGATDHIVKLLTQ